VLAVHNMPQRLVAEEVKRMREHRVAATANRSVVGVMVGCTHLANIYRDPGLDPDLLNLATQLARTPSSPRMAVTQPGPRARRPAFAPLVIP
jgi:hypothetical protein